jgi:hypothetical protein
MTGFIIVGKRLIDKGLEKRKQPVPAVVVDVVEE